MSNLPKAPEPESDASDTAQSEPNLSKTDLPAVEATATHFKQTFRLSPLIRLTLLLFYTALTLPLPFLAKVTEAPVPPWGLAIGLFIGAIALYGVLTERVVISSESIQVTYPAWVGWIWRRGWVLPWTEITALKPRSTGQGGIVYYFLSKSGQAYLLPMRIAGFADLVRQVEVKTGIDTRDVRPLAQPWMYLFLLILTVLLLAIDAWTILVAIGQNSGLG